MPRKSARKSTPLLQRTAAPKGKRSRGKASTPPKKPNPPRPTITAMKPPACRVIATRPRTIEALFLPAKYAEALNHIENARSATHEQYPPPGSPFSSPDAIVAAFQASGMLEESDAVFLRQDRPKPLPTNFDALPLAERELLSKAHIEERFKARRWFRVNEHSRRWDLIQLWGPRVRTNHPVLENNDDAQSATNAGSVLQWRALASLAMDYQRSWAYSLRTPELAEHAGLVQGDNPDAARIQLGRGDAVPFYAALPRELLDPYWASRSSQLDRNDWHAGIARRTDAGDIARTPDGGIVYEHEWERTHQATYAGSAVLAWAFAQRRLRAMFDKLPPAIRLQMPATVQCVLSVAPIVTWGAEEFALIARVERELVAVAHELKADESEQPASEPAKLSRETPTSQLPALTDDHAIVLRELEKRQTRRMTVTAFTALEKIRNRETAGRLFKECAACNLVESNLGRNKGYAITPRGLAWLKEFDATPRQ